MTQPRFDSLLHHHVVKNFLDKGHAPTTEQLAQALGSSVEEIEQGLHRLNDSHGLVLHPGSTDVWVVHPFTSSPTHTWIQAKSKGWWAPCMWCGLGIASLIKGELTIHTRIGGEKESIEVDVLDGVPVQSDLFVHFPEPPRRVWNNVHHFCARLLPFRSPKDAADWATRHQFPLGEVLPIAQLAELATRWYSHHADVNWEKWTPEQALEIFQSTGLVGDFWQLDTSVKHF